MIFTGVYNLYDLQSKDIACSQPESGDTTLAATPVMQFHFILPSATKIRNVYLIRSAQHSYCINQNVAVKDKIKTIREIN